MSSDIDSDSIQDSQNPYEVLGIQPGSSFEAIQEARSKRLIEVGEDSQAKAKIESSYDILLMNSLKERQLGKASNEALSASKKEEGGMLAGNFSDFGGSLVTKLKNVSPQSRDYSSTTSWANFSLPSAEGLLIRIALLILSLVLLLISPPEAAEIILSISTIGLIISQVRGGRRIISSIGWSVVLLSVGLICGGILSGEVNPQAEVTSTISSEQLESIPAIILIWLGSLFLR